MHINQIAHFNPPPQKKKPSFLIFNCIQLSELNLKYSWDINLLGPLITQVTYCNRSPSVVVHRLFTI